MSNDAEGVRLQEARTAKIPWRKWGPYLSERQWGTVREDYSQDGNAWDYFSHDQSRSRAYHWGEDGLAGISDEKQFLSYSMSPRVRRLLVSIKSLYGNAACGLAGLCETS
jgi:hypothetical protein